MIDSEEYREGTYEKLDNRYPLGVSLEKEEGITEYFWYNGSTSFVDGEKLKWRTRKRSESETEERAGVKGKIPITKTRNVVSYS